MRNITFILWLGSTSKRVYAYNESLSTYENACRAFDLIDDDLFIDPDDVIEKLDEIFDDCINNPYEVNGDTIDYEYRDTDGTDYTDMLIVDFIA